MIKPSNIKGIKEQCVNLPNSNSKISSEGGKQGTESNFHPLARMQIYVNICKHAYNCMKKERSIISSLVITSHSPK